MKTFRYVLVTVLLTATVFGSILYSGCKKDKCGSTTCQNGGTCTDNVCVCPAGYLGDDCSQGWSDVVIGTYNCTRENCLPSVAGQNTWISAVTKDVTDGGYTIDISNFDNSNTTILATVDSTDNVVISSHTGVNGNGTYANDTVKLTFTTAAVGGIGGYTCHMTMVKEQ